MTLAIRIEHIAKTYRLGNINHGLLYKDLQSWWARFRGRGDPNARIHETAAGRANAAGYFPALADVSFDVKQGELLGIIGRNGAGKSTLLKILSRVTAPTSGTIRIRGRIASLLEVGTGFHPELTGRENVFLNGAILGMSTSEITRKFDEIVAFAEVSEFIDTPVKRYSSGMHVRLAFAVAAHLEPEILLIDEVLAVGDAGFQKKCLGKMATVGKEGRTILFVSHQMEAIQNLCTRAVLLLDGRVAMDASPNEAIAAYIRGLSLTSDHTPLGDRTDRQGNNHYVHNRIWLEDEARQQVNAARPGQSIYIHVEIVPRGAKPLLMEAVCGIGFHDLNGMRLFTLSSDLLGRRIRLCGKTVLTWKIHEVALCEGEYRCNVFLARGVNTEIIDWVQDAFIFRVAPHDYFGTGRTAQGQRDRIFVRHDLSLTHAEPPAEQVQ